MQDLIQKYLESRRLLADSIRKLELTIRTTNDGDMTDLQHDLSLLNGMYRDMTESISMMKSTFHMMRGTKESRKVILQDPMILQCVESHTHWNPDTENDMRNQILESFGKTIRERMHLLTSKQMSTLERWISGSSISQIAREDGVSRQAVWVRIFGNRTNLGALKILREGRGAA